MEQRQPRRWRAVALVIALAVGAIPGSAMGVRDRHLRVEELTETAAGQAAARRAVERMRDRYGVRAATAELAVWSVGGRKLVGPRGSTLTVREIAGPDGSLERFVEATEGDPDAEGAHRAGDAAPAANPALGWQLVGDHCWIADDRDYAWMDVCYHKYRATTDGSGRYDFYALQMFSTFAAPGPGIEIGDPWIEARPDTKGAAHTWFDWDPRADTTRNCENPGLSVSVNGFGLSLPAIQCETWDITKYGTAGRFRNAWREGFCQIQKGERELAFEIVSRVAQDKVPRWVFPWKEHIQFASCWT